MAKLTARFDLQDRMTSRLRAIRGEMVRIDRLRQRTEQRPFVIRVRDRASQTLRRIHMFILRDIGKSHQLVLSVKDLATRSMQKMNRFIARRMPRTHEIMMKVVDRATPQILRLRRYLDRHLSGPRRILIEAKDRATAVIRRISRYAKDQLERGYNVTVRAVDMVTKTVNRIVSSARREIPEYYKSSIQAIDRFTAPARRVTSFANQHLNRTWTATVKVLDLATKPLKAIASAATSTLGILGVGAGATGGIVVPLKMVADRQNMTTAFETLLGSRAKADQRLDELTTFAGQTPFTRDEIFESSRVLQVFTGNALSTAEGMKLVGDVAAGVQRPFSEVALWMGRLYDGIKSGRPIGDATAALQEMGAISGEARGKLEKLAESGQDISKTWPQVTKEFSKYNDMMVKMSDNLANLFLGVKSFINNSILMPWGKGLAEAFQPALEAFREWRGEYSFVLTDLTNKAQKAGKAFAESFLNPTKNVFGFIGEQFKILFPGELTKKQKKELELKFKEDPKLKKRFDQLQKYRDMDFETRWHIVLDNTKDVFGEWWKKTGEPGLIKMAGNLGSTYGGIINGVINGLLGIDDKSSENGFVNAGTKAGRTFVVSFVDALDPVELSMRIAKKLAKLNWDAVTGQGSVGGALLADAFALAFIGKVGRLLKPVGKLVSGVFAGYKWLKNRPGSGGRTGGPLTPGVKNKRAGGGRRGPEYRNPWFGQGERVSPSNPNQTRGGGFWSKAGKGAKSVGKRVPILGTALAATELIGMNKDNAGEKLGGFGGGLAGSAGGASAGAAVGTLIAPGVGTAIGGVIGGVAGGIGGSDFGQSIGKWIDDGGIMKTWDTIVKKSSEAWTNIQKTWEKVSDWFEENVSDPVSKTFDDALTWIKNTWSTVTTWFEENVWDPFLKPVVDFAIQVWGWFKQAWAWIQDTWKTVKTWFQDNVWTPIYNIGVRVINNVVGFFAVAWYTIQLVWGIASSWFMEYVWDPILSHVVQFAIDVWNWLVQAWNWISETWETVSTWFVENVWDPILSHVVQFALDVWDWFVKAWNWISETWETVSTWFVENVWDPILEPAIQTATDIWNWLVQAWNWIKETWDTVSTWFTENVWDPIIKNLIIAAIQIYGHFMMAKNKVIKYWTNISDWFDENVREPIVGVANDISEAFEKAFGWVSNVWDKVKDFGGGIKQGLDDLWQGKNKTTFEKIGEEKTGWKPKEIPEKNATGGYITKPTISWIGEAGNEFVIPTQNNRGRGKMLLSQAATQLGMRVVDDIGSVSTDAGTVAPISSVASYSASVSPSMNAGNMTNQASSFGQQFTDGFDEGLNSNVVSIEDWKKKNIQMPFNNLMTSSPSFGKNVVAGYASGQNATATGTDGFLQSKVKTPFQNTVNTASSWGVNTVRGFAAGQNATPTGTNQYVSTHINKPFLDSKQSSRGWGSGMIGNFVSGLNSKASEVKEAAKELAKKVEQAFRDELDIHSPSRVMMSLGRFASVGIVKGLSSVDVKSFAEKQAGSLAGAFAGMGAVGGNIKDWLQKALMITGTSMSWLGPLSQMAMHESGGNPRAINLWDSNAKRGTPSKGLMQTIDPTFNAYKMKGLNDIWNPIHNAVAAINYIKARYGSVFNTPGMRSKRNGGGYKGYANGGLITNEQIARIGEGGKREWIIPEERGIRGRYLLSQAAQALGLDVIDPSSQQSGISSDQVDIATSSQTGAATVVPSGTKEINIHFNGDQHFHNDQDVERLIDKIKQALVDELEEDINIGTKGSVAFD
ncbi:transglycosylase SLT domain-containing protein [Bacillus haynesii]|uniref:transglycosylase SLT domain-containing protein n=1 Tax=Bacillus haynesii TaxID=1925021 RepID=UPI0022826A3D|nr:transglycosylase SLT domain-containing protein [Bacillus haynesii]MCY8540129.1 transglycosylase SLT domain-containing protein [Bacillus haynesii]